MGYDIHITRQENWFDENEKKKISLSEWKDFLASDPEMRLDNYAEAATTTGEILRVESEGLAVWAKYSGDGIGHHAWFSYILGNIIVKNPDAEIIHKMLAIAERLGAKVQGDEGEEYSRSSSTETVYSRITESRQGTKKNKPWWKFW